MNKNAFKCRQTPKGKDLVEYSFQMFLWVFYQIHSFFQRENMEELMENKVTEVKKTVQKRMEPELKLINMDKVEVEQIEWLFYPFIPYGKVTIIQGDPGEGKTTMVLQIIAKLTRGEAILPTVSLTDDKENAEVPVNVIYQTAEDGLGDTIKPRLPCCRCRLLQGAGH